MSELYRSEIVCPTKLKSAGTKGKRFRLPALVVGFSLGITACTGGENPQLAMCQKVAGNLAGKVSSWDKTDVSESGNNMTVNASYTLSSGDSGKVSCLYKRDNSDRNVSDPPFQTAPYKVTMNGEAIGTKELIKAGLKASKETLSEVAAETSKQASENAKLANEKASELAEKVGEMSDEANRRTDAFAEEAGEKARELGDKAIQVTKEAAEKVQEAIEN